MTPPARTFPELRVSGFRRFSNLRNSVHKDFYFGTGPHAAIERPPLSQSQCGTISRRKCEATAPAGKCLRGGGEMSLTLARRSLVPTRRRLFAFVFRLCSCSEGTSRRMQRRDEGKLYTALTQGSRAQVQARLGRAPSGRGSVPP